VSPVFVNAVMGIEVRATYKSCSSTPTTTRVRRMAMISELPHAITAEANARNTHRAPHGMSARQRHTDPIQPPEPARHIYSANFSRI